MVAVTWRHDMRTFTWRETGGSASARGPSRSRSGIRRIVRSGSSQSVPLAFASGARPDENRPKSLGPTSTSDSTSRVRDLTIIPILRGFEEIYRPALISSGRLGKSMGPQKAGLRVKPWARLQVQTALVVVVLVLTILASGSPTVQHAGLAVAGGSAQHYSRYGAAPSWNPSVARPSPRRSRSLMWRTRWCCRTILWRPGIS